MVLLVPLLQVAAQASLPVLLLRALLLVLLLGPLLRAPLRLQARALLLRVPLPALLLGPLVQGLVRLAGTAATWGSLPPPPLVVHLRPARSAQWSRWGAAGSSPGRWPPFRRTSIPAAGRRLAPLP